MKFSSLDTLEVVKMTTSSAASDSSKCRHFRFSDGLRNDALYSPSVRVDKGVFCKFKFWSFVSTWWRHQMETFSALLALWAGNSSVTGLSKVLKMYEKISQYIHGEENQTMHGNWQDYIWYIRTRACIVVWRAMFWLYVCIYIYIFCNMRVMYWRK